MPPIAEIKKEAVFETHRMEQGRGFPYELWSSALTGLELLTIGPKQYFSLAESPYREAQQLIESVRDNTGIMIALVFNDDRTKVTALPLPEIYENRHRVELGTIARTSKPVLEDVVRNTHDLLKDQRYTPWVPVSQDVIIIQQNIGYARSEHSISIGFWNIGEANRASRHAAPYEQRLEQVRQELNREQVSQ